jgi:hypothetical protein
MKPVRGSGLGKVIGKDIRQRTEDRRNKVKSLNGSLDYASGRKR